MKLKMDVKCILPTKQPGISYIDEEKMYLKDINTVSEADGEAVFQSNAYREIFQNTRNTDTNYKKRLAIVKISANGKSIHRAYISKPVTDINKSDIGLTFNSLRLLSDKDGKNPTEVKVTKGRYFPFYWHHPDKAIRISFKLGLLGSALGVLSFVIAIVSLFK